MICSIWNVFFHWKQGLRKGQERIIMRFRPHMDCKTFLESIKVFERKFLISLEMRKKIELSGDSFPLWVSYNFIMSILSFISLEMRNKDRIIRRLVPTLLFPAWPIYHTAQVHTAQKLNKFWEAGKFVQIIFVKIDKYIFDVVPS